jgi:hypothetical protein
MYPRQPIEYRALDIVAADQGYVYEKLLGVDAADGTTTPPPTNVGHNHSEAGNRIYKALLTSAWGCTDGEDQAIWSTASIEQRSFTVWPTSATTTLNAIRMLSMIFYVPAAFVDQKLVFAMDCDGRPRGLASIYDDTLAAVETDKALQPLHESLLMFEQSGASSFYGFDFEVSAAGVYVIDIYTNIAADQEPLIIRGCMVVPDLDPKKAGPYAKTHDVSASNYITVGDPDNSNAWHPIDDVWTSSDRPLGAGMMLIANNNAFLYESATGVVVPGNATRTASGHIHNGAAGYGDEIEFPVGAWCFGSAFPVSSTEVWGNNARAPIPDSGGVSREVFRTRVYIPSSSTTANLKCWALVAGDTGKAGTIEVVVSVGGNTQTFTSTGATSADPAYLDIVGGTAFGSYSGGSVNVVIVKVRLTAATTGPGEAGKPRVLGVCLAVVP